MQIGKPLSNACLHGYNGTIFAYGQTGSGKTHTILGMLSGDSLFKTLYCVFSPRLCVPIDVQEMKKVKRESFTAEEKVWHLRHPMGQRTRKRLHLLRRQRLTNLQLVKNQKVYIQTQIMIKV